MNAITHLLFRHRWKTTRVNPYGIATEQRCWCGTYRHHTADDLSGINMGDEPLWHEGRHPGSPEETNAK